jgi:hypothetical protein
MRFPLRAIAISLAIAILAPLLSSQKHAALADGALETPAAKRERRADTSLDSQRPTGFAAPAPSLVLDESDETATLHAIHIALQTVGDGGAYVWHRGHGLLDGMIRPTTSFKGANGQVCRHIIIRLNSGRYSREVEGIACQDASGRWSLSG